MIGCLLQASTWGAAPKPRHVPWSVIKQVTFWFTGGTLNPLSYTSQGQPKIFIKINTYLVINNVHMTANTKRKLFIISLPGLSQESNWPISSHRKIGFQPTLQNWCHIHLFEHRSTSQLGNTNSIFKSIFNFWVYIIC